MWLCSSDACEEVSQAHSGINDYGWGAETKKRKGKKDKPVSRTDHQQDPISLANPAFMELFRASIDFFFQLLESSWSKVIFGVGNYC